MKEQDKTTYHKILPLSDRDAVALMKGTTPINLARRVFSSYSAQIEQQSNQKVSILELRKLEFEAVMRIASILGTSFTPDGRIQGAENNKFTEPLEHSPASQYRR